MITIGVILVAIAGLSAAATIYPYIGYPALLRFLPKHALTIGPDRIEDGSRFAVLFCAFNEERCAVEKVENLRQLKARYPSLQVLIYDDGSTDRTRELFSALGPDVVRLGPGRTGKATGMKLLVESTDRPLLVFTDANVMLDQFLIERAARYFDDDSVGGICGHLQYEGSEETATQAAGGAYWRLEERIKRRESATGSVMGGDGSIFVMRRSLYPDVPYTAQDDFTATMNVVLSGKRLVMADDVIASERLVAKSGDEYRRKVRIAARAMHTHLTMRSRLRKMSGVDRWKYVSHKIIRWYGAFFLSAGALSGIAGLAILDPLVGGVVLALAGALGVAIFTTARLGPVKEILIAIFATGQGVILGLRGKTFATWTPPQSR